MIVRKIVRWAGVVCALLAGAFAICAACFAFADIMVGRGGGAGNILRAGFGALSLFAGACLVIIGISGWRSLRPNSLSARRFVEGSDTDFELFEILPDLSNRLWGRVRGKQHALDQLQVLSGQTSNDCIAVVALTKELLARINQTASVPVSEPMPSIAESLPQLETEDRGLTARSETREAPFTKLQPSIR